MTKRFKTPTVLQMEASECGAASLAMVLAFYGRYVPLEQLRMECGISRDGSKANYILRAARLHGLVASGYQVEIAEIKKVPLPAILFWEFNHFVVLEGIKGDKFYINDPALGHRKLSMADFKKSFTGIVLEFKVGPQFQPGGKKPSALAAVLNVLQESPAVIFYFAVATFLMTLLMLAMPASVRFFIDHVLIQKSSSLIQLLIGFVLLLGLVFALLRILVDRIAVLFENNLASIFCSQFYSHLLRLPLPFFSERYVSDLSERMQTNIQVAKMASVQVVQGMLGLWGFLIFVAAMAFYDWQLTIFSVVVFILGVAIVHVALRRQGEIRNEIAFQNARMTSTVMSELYHIESIKAHGGEQAFFSRFQDAQVKKTAAARQMVIKEAFLDALAPFLLVFSFVVILGLGSLNVFEGELSIGMMVAFLLLTLLCLKSVIGLAQVFHRFGHLDFDQGRINDVMHFHLDPEFSQKKVSGEQLLMEKKLSGKVSIQNLSFGYSPYAKPLIENFNLEIKPGGRIAIVGASGSGKSTIVKLIGGLLQPLSGRILFDDLERSQIPRDILVKEIGYVEQEIYFFTGTIWENLTLWDASIQMADVQKACADAQIYEDVQTILDGFDGQVEEGGKNLSGGERQRLEIARVLLHNPSIILLDECMSALDPLTEKAIDQSLHERGSTCIFVAHRLSTIRDADEIIVLDAGRVVQRGLHEQLVKEIGPYQKLIELGA